MPDVELRGINFTLKNDVTGSVAGINDLADAIKQLKKAVGSFGNKGTQNAVQQVVNSVSGGADPNGTKSKNVINIAKAFASISKSTEGIRKKLGGFLSSIGRIALYRAIRSAIKMVTQGIKTGIDNFYRFSKSIGGDFYKNMDKLTTKFQTLQNSIGALAASFINTFYPAIETGVNALIDFNNQISEIMAAGAGKKTYIAATDALKEYIKAQRQIMGFDELNILKDDADYSKMFEERQVSLATQDATQSGLNGLQQALTSEETVGDVTRAGMVLGEALIGGMIGKIAGPEGAAIGAALGAAIGGITIGTGWLNKLNFADDLDKTLVQPLRDTEKKITEWLTRINGKLGTKFGEFPPFFSDLADSITKNLDFTIGGSFDLLTGNFEEFGKKFEEAAKSTGVLILNSLIGIVNTAFIDGLNLAFVPMNTVLGWMGIPTVPTIPHIPYVKESSDTGAETQDNSNVMRWGQEISQNGPGVLESSLNGLKVVMDGYVVGQLVSDNQNNDAKQRGQNILK